MNTLAIDVGATKTLINVCTKAGNMLSSIRLETPKHYEDFIEMLSTKIPSISENNINVCIIALPGIIDHAKNVVVKFGNLDWKDKDIVSDLSGSIDCDIYIENDTKLATLYAAHSVKDKYRKVLYITVSTGIGSGLAMDGRLDQATINSEIGFMRLPYKGELIEWEEFASGSAIKAKYGKLASDITDPQAWEDISNNLALGIYEASAAYAPECIMLGGGVATNYNKFIGYLKKSLQLLSSTMVTIPPILQVPDPDNAVINGIVIYAQQTS
jgi:predicted NBD/HSP70 family sugar kinase